MGHAGEADELSVRAGFGRLSNDEEETERKGVRRPGYDSSARRQELAESLEGVADVEAVQARFTADMDQATPPSAAVANAPGRSPKAYKSRGANGQTKLLQKAMSR